MHAKYITIQQDQRGATFTDILCALCGTIMLVLMLSQDQSAASTAQTEYDSGASTDCALAPMQSTAKCQGFQQSIGNHVGDW